MKGEQGIEGEVGNALVLSDRFLFLRVVVFVKVVDRVTGFRDRFFFLLLYRLFPFSNLFSLFRSPCSKGIPSITSALSEERRGRERERENATG